MAARRGPYADQDYADEAYRSGPDPDDDPRNDGYPDDRTGSQYGADRYDSGRYDSGRYDDRYDADPDEGAPVAGAPRRRRLLPIAGSVVVLGLFGGAIWYAYQAGVHAGSDAGVPLIIADEAPVRARPADPGGLEVPHQNVLVYNRLKPEPGRPAPEQLLPPPEQPIPRSAIPTMGNQVRDAAPPAAMGAAAPPPVPNEPELMAEGTTGPVDGEEESDVTTAPAEPPAKPAPPSTSVAMLPPPVPKPAPTPSTAPSGGSYRVQLASLRSEADARDIWDRLQKTQPGLLGKLQAQVVRTDLGPGRGVYYRLQAGPLSEKTLADMLCSELKSRKVECLIVQP